MKNLPRLKAQLKRHEGIRYKPYRCTADKLTIGVGRNLDDKGISEAEAEFLLENDITDACIAAATLPGFREADSVRQCAIVNFVFNVGLGTARKFSNMFYAFERKDWNTAAAELLNSRYAKQVGKRADELAEQIRSGQWQD